MSHSTGLLFVWLRTQPCLCGGQAQKALLCRAVGQTLQRGSRGAGVGFVKNGTLEVNLKEQEGTFYGDEIKGLGEGQEGCSSHCLQRVESHWD